MEIYLRWHLDVWKLWPLFRFRNFPNRKATIIHLIFVSLILDYTKLQEDKESTFLG